MIGGTLSDTMISKLTLGTVQFGQDYGIANRFGKPPYEEVRAIIACGYEAGVNCLDTAAGYGDSERVLGRVLSELGIRDDVTVVTKVPHMPDGISSKAADIVIERSVTDSLDRLRLDVLPICLLHVEKDICYVDSLLRMKSRGLIRRLGVSVMTPQATRQIIDLEAVDVLQIPTNILDKRFTGSGITSLAAESGLMLFVRSIYLQGLLLMPEETIRGHLRDVIPARREFEKLAFRAGMGLAELAARYVLSIDGITGIIVGVDNVAQMKENIALFRNGPLSIELVQEVDKIAPGLDDRILMPTMWHTDEPLASG